MPILDTSAPPAYQRIAGKAAQLRELGLSDSAIARRLVVSDKTVTKAIDWMQGLVRHDNAILEQSEEVQHAGQHDERRSVGPDMSRAHRMNERDPRRAC